MRVFARQAVGAVDIEGVDAAEGDEVAQPLQCWPDQGGPAIAVVDKLLRWIDAVAVCGSALAQGGHLARNRLGLGLPLGLYARVQRNLQRTHRRPSRRARSRGTATAVP